MLWDTRGGGGDRWDLVIGNPERTAEDGDHGYSRDGIV